MARAFLEVFQEVIETLESAEIEYMIVGSIAAMVYGDPRLTHDMDVVIDLRAEQVKAFPDMFPREEYYLPPQEIIAQEALNRRPFNVLHLASGLKIDFVVRRATAHAKEEFARRKRMTLLPGFQAYVAAAEDVILKKLEFFLEGGSHKHLTDIRSILANKTLDQAYIERWVELLHLDAAWREAQLIN